MDASKTFKATENLYLYAIFKPITLDSGIHTVTVHSYDETLGTTNSGGSVFLNTDKGLISFKKEGGSLQASDNTKVELNGLADNGYKFVEWRKDSPTGEVFRSYEYSSFKVTEDIELYAVYREAYEIAFNPNGADDSTKYQSTFKGVKIRLNKNTFRRQGYEFNKWTTNADGTGDSYTDEQTVLLTSNLTLYAQWEKLPTKISYTTHVQNYGWQPYVSNGAMAGTSGEGKRLEAIKIKLEDQEFSGDILYRTHVQSYGWEEEFKKNNELSGTESQGKRLEAIKIK